MTTPREAGHELDQALQRVATERRRAARAAEIAERHESQALTDTQALREFHGRIAAMHRRAQRRHLAAAGMHTAYVERLRRWVEAADYTRALPGLIAAVAEAVGARGVAVTLFGANEGETLVVSSDPAAKAAQDLEFTLGEGPTRDSAYQRRPVSAAGRALRERWPLYGPAVELLGVRTVTAVPMELASATLGALTAFEPQHDLGDDLERLYAAADTLALSVLPASFGPEQPEDPYGLPLPAGADLHPVVHQATGVVSVQHNCSTTDALALIRAHAFAQNRPIDEVAAAIVDRRLRLP